MINKLLNYFSVLENKGRNNKKFTTYLAGPMEFSDDRGMGWRPYYQATLRRLGIHAIVPNQEEAGFVKDVEAFEKSKIKNFPKYIKIMRKLIELDLGIVKKVDFVIVHWTGEPTAGTIGEVQHAYLNNIPVYLIHSVPREDVPGWVLACATEVYDNFYYFLEFLREEYLL